METSQLVAAILMMVSPALFALSYQLYHPIRALDVDDRKTRGLHIALWSMTIACVGIWAGLFAGRPDPSSAGWSDTVRWLVSGGRVERLVWLLSFPPWFGVAMRFLVMHRPEPRSAFPKEAVRRNARLTARPVVAPISAASWRFLWGVFGFSVVAVALRALPRLPGESSLSLAGAAVLLLLTLVPLALAPAAVRTALRDPEPMDPDESRELSDLYAVHRVSKVWGLYWIFLGLVALLSFSAVCGVWAVDTSDTVSTVVGVGGSAVGIWGAVFGIHMANQRLGIRRLLDRAVKQ